MATKKVCNKIPLGSGILCEGLEVAETQIGTAKASNNLRQLEQCRYAAVGGTKDWR